MLRTTVFRITSITLALVLGACSWMQQPAAPVVAGNSSVAKPPVVEATSPYGTQPYNPNASNNIPSPYTPTPSVTPVVSVPYIPSNAPVDINAPTHTVIRGDTVYNISKRYGIGQDDLRAWNNLTDNTISIGQVLNVKPTGGTGSHTVTPISTTVVTSNPVPPSKNTIQTVKVAPTTSISDTRQVAGIIWQKPTSGKIIANFGGNNKGVDIAGNPGQAIVSAADGKVVYAGSGLRGYGNLVIVQHNATYLTAYGHNQSLLVKEGQAVKRGQTIALMGNTDTDRTKLHFEVRQGGNPVNPTQYISF